MQKAEVVELGGPVAREGSHSGQGVGQAHKEGELDEALANLFGI